MDANLSTQERINQEITDKKEAKKDMSSNVKSDDPNVYYIGFPSDAAGLAVSREPSPEIRYIKTGPCPNYPRGK